MNKGLALLDSARIARAKAHLHAWWEGIDPPSDELASATEGPNPESAAEAPALASSSQSGGGAAETLSSPRQVALARLWGQGRASPEDPGRMGVLVQRLAAPKTAAIAVLGPGGAALLAEARAAHPGRLSAHEWRADFTPALTAAAAELGADVFPWTFGEAIADQRAFQGLISLEEIAFAPDLEAFAQACHAALAPGARAAVEGYVGDQSERAGSAFATSCAAPQLRAAAALAPAFEAAGFIVEAEEDRTEAHIAAAKAGFRQFTQAASEAGAAALAPGVAQELAWEAACWRLRLTLLGEGALARRALLLRKPPAPTAKPGLLGRLLRRPTRAPS